MPEKREKMSRKKHIEMPEFRRKNATKNAQKRPEEMTQNDREMHREMDTESARNGPKIS